MVTAIPRRAAALLALAAVLGTAGWGSASAASGTRAPGQPEGHASTAQAQAPRARCQADGPLRQALGGKAGSLGQPATVKVIAVPSPSGGADGPRPALLHG